MQVKLTGVAGIGMTRATKRDDKNMPVLVWDETTVKIVFKDLSQESENEIKRLMGRPGMELTFELSSPQMEMTGLQSPDGVAMPMTPSAKAIIDAAMDTMEKAAEGKPAPTTGDRVTMSAGGRTVTLTKEDFDRRLKAV